MRSLNCVISTVPRRSQIKELYQLEIADERIIYRPIKKSTENWCPDLAIDNNIIITISRVLFKATKINSQCLVSIINIRGRPCGIGIVEFWRKPSIYATEVINYFLIAP